MPFIQNAPGERQVPPRRLTWTMAAISATIALLATAYVTDTSPWNLMPLAMLGTAYGTYFVCNIGIMIPKTKLIDEIRQCRDHYRPVIPDDMRWMMRSAPVVVTAGPALMLNFITAEPASIAQHCLAVAALTACIAIPTTLIQGLDMERQYRIHQADYCPYNLINDGDNVVHGSVRKQVNTQIRRL